MTHPRTGNDFDRHAAERALWVRPSVRRLAAGSAEDGASKLGDSGIKPS